LIGKFDKSFLDETLSASKYRPELPYEPTARRPERTGRINYEEPLITYQNDFSIAEVLIRWF
jgi:hypothetical protein